MLLLYHDDRFEMFREIVTDNETFHEFFADITDNKFVICNEQHQ